MIKNIGIVGLGLMGGSLALAIKKFIPEIKIYGFDFDDILEIAKQIKCIDVVVKDIKDFPEDIDIIFLATPIAQNLDILKKVSEIKQWKNVLITDLGSTKASINKLADELQENNWCFIGGHPMTGSEKQGIKNANAYLFQNAVYVVTPSETKKPTDEVMSDFINILYQIGARIIKLNPELHDKLVAHISHLPYILSISLINFLEKETNKDTYYRLASGGFRDLTRVAESPNNIWLDIFSDNRDNITYAIDSLIDYLGYVKNNLTGNNLKDDLGKARKVRLKLPSDTKGFINPLVDIRVEVEDKPGVIADISNILTNAGINIKDITILKIRENLGGVLQLSFENKNIAYKAMEKLKEKDYVVMN